VRAILTRHRFANRFDGDRPLPDFYIGAHAVLSGLALLTRDARRYRSYFPPLELIAP
jgi:predicted nucleic acid-binding protein